MTIAECNRRVQNAISGLENAIINEIIPQVENDITTMQKDRIFSGKYVDDTEIIPEYTYTTLGFKLRKGQPTDRVTLFDTGSFHNQIFAESYDGKEVIIDSRDEKSSDLKEKYGEQIFGLTKDNTEDLHEITTDLLVEYVKRETGLN
jgi:hypothetical protein